MGATFIASGTLPILAGFGIVHTTGPSVPTWLPIAVGLIFVCGGVAVILDYAVAGGITPDGDFLPGTSSAIRCANLILGLAIIGLMTAVSAWIAFGTGSREFSTVVSLPFVPLRWQSGDLSGRIAFGLSTALLALMFTVCGISGFRRLLALRRRPGTR